MLNDLISIEKENLIKETTIMKSYSFRFVALTAEKESNFYELTYHFDLDYKMKHIRINVLPSDTIESISSIYPSAFLIENEYQDLYGFIFNNLSINYKGHLYLTENSKKTPLLQNS